MDRRAVLGGLLALAARPTEASQPEGLATKARRKGVAYGAATSARHIDISEFAAALQRECSILVGENDFKWRNTQPQPDRKTWGHA
ncbi:MAG: hypothetical protein ACRDBL_14455, partial [Rhabdaerophilum sp.]